MREVGVQKACASKAFCASRLVFMDLRTAMRSKAAE